jgi:hypothetical protein
MNINFAYDIHQDIWNYFFRYINPAINSEHQLNKIYGKSAGLNNLNNKNFPKTTASIIKSLPKLLDSERGIIANKIYNFLDKNIVDTSLLSNSIKTLTQEWKKYDTKYYARLKKYFNIKNIRPMQAYLTSIFGCPYNPDAGTFFVPIEARLEYSIQVIMHESMHIVFLDNFENYMRKKGLNSQGIFIITETIVELLHTEFQDLNPMVDNHGIVVKKDTVDFVDKMHELWREGKSFPFILDVLIDMAFARQK